MQKTSILIIDDHALIRETWSFILSNHPKFTVIGEAGSGEEGIELAKKLLPDVIIMDINLPKMTGIEATQQIGMYSPNSKILGVSLHTQPTYARKMMQMGASGYITKNSSREEMFEGLSQIQKGHKFICKEVKDILSEQVLSGDKTTKKLNELTQREVEVIQHIKKGCSSKEIAEELFLSVKTIEVHRYNILKKLNLKNTAALVNYINSNPFELAN